MKVKGRSPLGYYTQNIQDVSDLLIEVKKRAELTVGADLLTIFPSEADATTPEKACLACSVGLAVVVYVIEFAH